MEIDGIVYDLTEFMNEHPGGPAILLERAGKVASHAFKTVGHSENAQKLMKSMMVGRVAEGDIPEPSQIEGRDEKINPAQVAMILVAVFMAFLFTKYFAV